MTRDNRSVLRTLPRAACLALCLGLVAVAAAGETRMTTAPMQVEGLGWWQNRGVGRTLALLLGEGPDAGWDANALDDAAFLLGSILTEQGFLAPEITVEVGTDPARERFPLDASLHGRWPRTIRSREVRFRVDPGVRSRVEEVRFVGLDSIPAKVAQSYFRGAFSLLGSADRAYAPARAERGRGNLEAELRRLGLAEAAVGDPVAQSDPRSGAVALTVNVTEGPPWTVRSVRVASSGEGASGALDLVSLANRPWNSLWQQNVLAAVRNDFLARGYPDATVRVETSTAPEPGGMAVAVTVHVEPGGLVRSGAVRFEGVQRTRDSVLRRRVQVGPGALLDPLYLEQARARLAHLGVFTSVDLRYEPATGPVRSPVFAVREGRHLETNLLLGYGSYEELRGGVELRHFNLFGRAHRGRLLALQSMKSSSLDYTYSVPEMFGEDIDGTARVFGLQRDEFSFVRQEYGGSVHLKWPWAALGSEASAGYTFQVLRNLDNALATRVADERQSVVAAVDATLMRDRRDRPLRPRRGYRISGQIEAAARNLGSQVDYQKVELAGSYHTAVGGSAWLHLGLGHGLIGTLGGDDRDLPVNKRFFPGGAGSIRGYREGEAAPRGADGRFVGAKTFLLAQVEFEQAVTPAFSAVVFLDGLGVAARLADYPFQDRLIAAGLGARYQTLIGPIRLEYGHNLNRRPLDPRGTWLFSVGVPF